MSNGRATRLRAPQPHPAEPFLRRTAFGTRRTRRVAIVEDEELLRELFELVLTEVGYSVAIWAAGMPVLPFLRQALPDLLVLDLRLGELEGEAVLDELRRDPDFAGLPVLVCTGDHAAARRLEVSAASQGLAILLKPFGIARFLDQVTRLTGSELLVSSR